jgi:hypothetical protein
MRPDWNLGETGLAIIGGISSASAASTSSRCAIGPSGKRYLDVDRIRADCAKSGS